MKHILLAALSLTSLSLYAQEDTTSGPVPCEKIKGDASRYGCSSGSNSQESGIFKCLKKIPWEIDKGNILKARDKKMLALGDKEQDEVIILDGENSYKLKKQDFSSKIKEKYGSRAGGKKKAYVSVLGQKGEEVILEVENKNEGSRDFEVSKWKQVKKEALSEEQQSEMIHYPVGIKKKVPNIDSESDKLAKKFFQELEGSTQEEMTKKEDLYKKKIKDIDDAPELAIGEKIKIKDKIKKDHDKEMEIIRKKKLDALSQIKQNEAECKQILPETVEYVKNK